MIVIKKATNNEWYFIVKARNGRQLVKSGDTYKRKRSVLAAINSLKKSLDLIVEE